MGPNFFCTFLAVIPAIPSEQSTESMTAAAAAALEASLLPTGLSLPPVHGDHTYSQPKPALGLPQFQDFAKPAPLGTRRANQGTPKRDRATIQTRTPCSFKSRLEAATVADSSPAQPDLSVTTGLSDIAVDGTPKARTQMSTSESYKSRLAAAIAMDGKFHSLLA
ncbi:uncharacterized protein [Dermacentor andersoni]|uniref:uncharacterized protein n=1 Tax=Dermacentor andersoni TaxID=34620 RepID=UPI003B3A83F4